MLLLVSGSDSMASDSPPPCTLVLCGKSAAEDDIAKSLRDNNTLKVAENDGGVSVLLQSELEKSLAEDSFRVESFMNSLSTNRFGRFLLWSPRLPSTHDVVSLLVLQLTRLIFTVIYIYIHIYFGK